LERFLENTQINRYNDISEDDFIKSDRLTEIYALIGAVPAEIANCPKLNLKILRLKRFEALGKMQHAWWMRLMERLLKQCPEVLTDRRKIECLSREVHMAQAA
jgi:hypothetical protein